MVDRRQIIVGVGLKVLREHGYAGLTQPRVPRRAGPTQSLLTYYHPTRADLLAAVAQGAVERQLAALDAVFASITLAEQLDSLLAGVVTRHENTRVLLTLAQAGGEEPVLRVHFRTLANGIVERVGPVLRRLSVRYRERVSGAGQRAVGRYVLDGVGRGRPRSAIRHGLPMTCSRSES